MAQIVLADQNRPDAVLLADWAVENFVDLAVILEAGREQWVDQ
jgi:hypothetical protein